MQLLFPFLVLSILRFAIFYTKTQTIIYHKAFAVVNILSCIPYLLSTCFHLYHFLLLLIYFLI